MITDHSKCQFSTGIDEQLTAGQGELSTEGFWEFPCPECENRMVFRLNEPRCDCGHLFEICDAPGCPSHPSQNSREAE